MRCPDCLGANLSEPDPVDGGMVDCFDCGAAFIPDHVDPADIRRAANGTVRVIIRNSTAPGRLNLPEVREEMSRIAAEAAGIERGRFFSEDHAASSVDQTCSVTFYAD